MTEREVEICDRLRSIRLALKWSQAELAALVGTSRSVIGNIEYYRCPVRFFLGDMVCQRLKLNQQWLAAGDGETFGYVDIPADIRARFGPTATFSTAYDSTLAGIIEAVKDEDRETEKQIITDMGPGKPGRDQFEKYLRVLSTAFIDKLPLTQYKRYFEALMEASNDFLNNRGRNLELPAFAPTKKESVDTISEFRKPLVVKSELKQLLADVRRLTKAKGAKAQLAKKLDVPQSRLSEWLAGKYEPSGEIALRLRNWVHPPGAK
jgi:transcriptional regulator with XRE-family HTH domain